MRHVDADFVRLLDEYEPSKLEAQSGAIYGLWPDLRLAYLNPAWFRFATENQGEPHISQAWGLGADLSAALPWPLRQWYRDGYAECLRRHRSWSLEYECSSAELYRRFHQVVYPLGREEGLLIVNSLVLEVPHDGETRPCCEPLEKAYLDGDGLLHQCSHCRRVRRQGLAEHWDFVPQWIRQPLSNTSHTLCPACSGYYQAMLRP